MVRISIDVPQFIIEILSAVDYSRITDAHYNEWIKIIKANIGKHLKLKARQLGFIELDYPIRQDFCDLINRYDFSSINPLKQAIIVPLAMRWARENLPLKRKMV